MDFELNLNGETVDVVHPADPLAVEPDTPVRDVFALLKSQRTGSVLVCRDGVLIGIFTERDALRMMARGASLDVPIEQAMIADPVSIPVGASVGTAIRTMSEGGYRRLPIVDEQGRPQGVVKATGVVHYLVEHFPETVYNLPPQPNPTTDHREGA